ncbi:MAG: hypothetical protein U0V49_13810 [Saprospiraceae bacterium]
MLFSTLLLASSCKEDYQQKTIISLKINPNPSLTPWDCNDPGDWTCEQVTGWCNYNANCCSTRQDLARSSFGTSLDYAKALACELEKVFNGCTRQDYEFGCIEHTICINLSGLTNTAINSYYGSTTLAFDFCKAYTGTSPYSCSSIQYNVDYPIAAQDLFVSFIRGQYNGNSSCGIGYTKRLIETKFRVCYDTTISCIEGHCSNGFISADIIYVCCPQKKLICTT